MNLKISTTKALSDAQLRPLYETMNWSYVGKFRDLSVLLPGSDWVASAWDGARLIGLLRTVGDGVSVRVVQDLLVLPDYQRQDIGKLLMKRLLADSREIRQIEVATDGSEASAYVRRFYQGFGFVFAEKVGVKELWLLNDSLPVKKS